MADDNGSLNHSLFVLHRLWDTVCYITDHLCFVTQSVNEKHFARDKLVISIRESSVWIKKIDEINWFHLVIVLNSAVVVSIAISREKTLHLVIAVFASTIVVTVHLWIDLQTISMESTGDSATIANAHN